MGDPSEDHVTLLQRLKKRGIVQWTIGYLAGAWVVLEVFSTLQEGFDWPQRLFPLLISLLSVGLIITLVIAWFHGEKGRQRVSAPELLILGSVLLVGGLFVSRFSAADRTTGGLLVNSQGVAALATPVRASIAVLPFDDLSPDGDQRYFVEGLSEEIIHALTQITGLKVAARTSTFRLAEEGGSVTQMASTLGVAHVLEGSVRKSGDQVRITAQLIEAESGFHLWSDIFDRPLNDIVSVQDEIGRVVAERLETTLSADQQVQLVTQSTESTQAYEAYLLGRYYWNQNTVESLEAAIDAFERAIDLDPDFAQAYAGLADSYSALELYLAAAAGARGDPRELTALGLAAARQAVDLAPNLGMGHAALARALTKVGEWAEAESEFRASLALNPGYANAHSGYGLLLLYTGAVADAVEHLQEAKRFDPVSQSISVGLGIALHAGGYSEEAIEALRTATGLDRSWIPGWTFLSILLTEAGYYEEALAAMVRRAELQQMAPEALESVLVDMASRIDAIRRYRETGEPQSFQVSLYGSFDLLALTYHRAAAGQHDRALLAFGALVIARVYESAAALHVLFLGDILGDDPRYQSLLTQAGIG
jgi:TolB-like protein/cytochrome c-type biogenesis protein CcmH/NrfG